MRALIFAFLAGLAAFAAVPAAAQDTAIAFKGLKAAADQPVEITADSLEIDQGSQTALFKGNVLVIQGDMRLKAAELRVDYAQGDNSKIDRLTASGGVLLASPSEAVEADEAVYSLSSREIKMTGDVLLTQNQSVMSGQVLFVNLAEGTGRMDGRVKTILNPGGTTP